MRNTVNKRDDKKAALDIGIRLTYHITLICMSMYLFSNEQYLLSVLVAIPHWITYSFMGSAGLSHELFHNSVFSSARLNNALHKFFMVLNWENANYFKETHWIHHKITLDEKDPKTLFTKKINLLYLIQLLTFDVKGFLTKVGYIVKNAVGILPIGKAQYIFENDKEKMRRVTRMAQIILVFHIISSGIFIYMNQWWLVFLSNFAPFIVSFFNRVLGFAQHYGLNADAHTDYYNNSRTVVLSKFWSFFYSNMNYHIEHHLYPQVPYYRIEEIHHKIRTDTNYKNMCVGWKGLLSELQKKGMFCIL